MTDGRYVKSPMSDEQPGLTLSDVILGEDGKPVVEPKPFDPENPDLFHPDFIGFVLVCPGCRRPNDIGFQQADEAPVYYNEAHELVIRRQVACRFCRSVFVGYAVQERGPAIIRANDASMQQAIAASKGMLSKRPRFGN